MYVYERMNSWICRRVTNRCHPEANVMETYRVSGISVVAVPTCTYIHGYVMLQYKAANWQTFGDKCINPCCSCTINSFSGISKTVQVDICAKYITESMLKCFILKLQYYNIFPPPIYIVSTENLFSPPHIIYLLVRS